MKKLNLLVAAFATFVLVLTLTNVHAKTVYQEYLKRDIPVNYYSDVDTSASPSEVKAELTDILGRGFHHLSYSEVYDLEDETDPVLGNTKEGDALGFYSGVTVTRASGAMWYNREHVWAKSHGFPSTSQLAYSDIHHLRPTLSGLNSTRGNLYFGEVSGGKTLDYGNKVGDVFEPRDEVKGDVARILMYMEVRYCDLYNLKLVSKDAYTNSADPEMGNLQTLIKWNYEDPVSPAEIHRNEVCYKYQKNRNPFIDHPEYVGLVYPNDYQPEELDQQAIDNVKNLISALPQTISLSDKDAIDSARSAYDALSISEQNAVSNYSVLTSAESTLSALEEANKPVQDIFMSLNTVASLKLRYKQSGSTTLEENDYDFDAVTSFDELASKLPSGSKVSGSGSQYGYSGGDIKGAKLGSSKQTGYLNLIMPTSQDVYNSIEISMSPWQSSGSSTGTASKSEVTVTATSNDGTTATKTLEMKEAQNYKLELEVNSTVSKINIETTNNGKRAFIHSMKISKGKSNVKIDKMISKLRFGVFGISQKIIDSNASFGVVYSTSAITNSVYDGTIENYVSANEGSLNKSITKSAMAKDGDTYGFYATLDTPQNKRNTKYYAMCYIQIDGKLYFTNVLNYSVNSLSKEYTQKYAKNASVGKAIGALKYLNGANA